MIEQYSTRRANKFEYERLARKPGGYWGSILFIVFLCIGPSAFTGIILNMIESHSLRPWVVSGHLIGWSIGGLFTFVFCGWFTRVDRRNREKRSGPITIEEMTVRPTSCRLFFVHGNRSPNLAFDLGDKTLLLSGQWLLDRETYTRSARTEADFETFVNGLLPPHAFPSDRFSIRRWPQTGDVVGIKVLGDYSAPVEDTVDILPADFELADSHLIAQSRSELIAAKASN